MSRYCEPCKFLNLTEKRQNELKKIGDHKDHYCNLFKGHVLHQGEHPRLVRLPSCVATGKAFIQEQEQD